MKRLLAAAALVILVSSCASVGPAPPGCHMAASHTVVAGQPAELGIRGKAAHLEIEQTLEPGGPVEQWKADNQKARENGERFPDKLTVARLAVSYADGRGVEADIRYNESVGALRREWWNPVDGFIHHLAFAQVAWTRPIGESGLRHNVVYRMRWANPRPEVAIRSIEVKPAEGLGEGRLLIFDAATGSTPSAGATYFVAPDGDDSAPGTFDRPWTTLHKAAETIQSGDTVYVRGGTYRPTERILFKYIDAPEGQRTRIIGYPGETATFDFMDAHWDTSPERRQYGFEPYPHDQSMIMAYDCDRFTFKNLHLTRSRARGFGMETGWWKWAHRDNLIDGGRPEVVNNTPFQDSEICYCSTYMTYNAGIRFRGARKGRLIGNVLMRPETIAMGPADPKNPGSGPVAGLDATTFYSRSGNKKRNPPMEGIDGGGFHDVEVAYNEICWGDKECFLIDGDVDGLRVHHNYVHDAWNLPWVGGISPNGYGRQEDIKIDHNIAHHVGTGFGIGTEGGGWGKRVRIHHNLAYDCHWSGVGVSGAWKSNASLYDISVYNNTLFHNGHYTRNPRIRWRENRGPAGGISVSFPAEDLEGVVEDVVVANNLILRPRDYALTLNGEGDPEESNIVFTHNVTDLEAESDIFDLERNSGWHPVRDDGLLVVERPLLRDPRDRDFRLVPSTPATDAGIAINPRGKPDPEGGKTCVGAFGPDSKWVELDP